MSVRSNDPIQPDRRESGSIARVDVRRQIVSDVDATCGLFAGEPAGLEKNLRVGLSESNIFRENYHGKMPQ